MNQFSIEHNTKGKTGIMCFLRVRFVKDFNYPNRRLYFSTPGRIGKVGRRISRMVLRLVLAQRRAG